MELLTTFNIGNYFLLLSAVSFGLALLVVLRGCIRKQSILESIPGPTPDSWILGNQAQYDRSQAGVCELKWSNIFGNTYRVKGGFGENVLVTSDPKAMQFILQTTAYAFERPPFFRERFKSLMGRGILSAEHEEHKRQRKVMLPAFTLTATKALVPMYRSAVLKLTDKWDDDLKQKEQLHCNIHRWLARATLDAIGEAAFNYTFGALDSVMNPLAKNFQNLTLGIRGLPSLPKIAIMNALFQLPPSLVYIYNYIPMIGSRRSLKSRKVSMDTAKILLTEKADALGTEEERKDVMSLLVRSNHSENPKTRLSEQEMMGQMATIIFAGHETTANTLSWTLFELAKNPTMQDTLRQEIRHWNQVANKRGDRNINVDDYDKMTLMTGVMKESFRLNSILPQLQRIAARDITIPLSQPIHTSTGDTLQVIPIKKGTRIQLSILQYNRDPSVWGMDASTFNPERWLTMQEPKIKLGVYGNLAIFGGGVHACLGWRFAVYELQTFLIELLDKYKFEMTDEARSIRRVFAGTMVPLVDGNDEEVCLPLKVSKAP